MIQDSDAQVEIALTRLLYRNNLRHVLHEDTTLELKTQLCRFVFTHELVLLLIWVHFFAAEQDTFKKVDFILIDNWG